MSQSDNNKSRIRIVLQLQEARIGDPSRLESIKESLTAGKELPESDVQYLKQTSGQLKTAIEHQMMCDWAIDFVKKFQEKKNKKEFTLDEIQKSLEKEKKGIKIDQRFLDQITSKFKQLGEQEKKSKWTLDLISQLREAKIGDSDKFDQITRTIKSGKAVDEIDKKYLMEKQMHFKKVVENKTKVSWSIDAIKKLQETEVKHSNKLEKIRHAVEQGKPISENEQTYLDARYEKLRHVVEERNKIVWTIQTIEKLRQFRIGDNTKFDSIKQLLEEEIPVPEDEVNYLKEQYKMLRQVLNNKKKLELVVGLVDDLQATEIGDSQRLAAIKKSIEEGKPIEENEINYLKQKYKILDIIAKNSEKEYQTNNILKEEVDYNSVLSGLNEAITKLQSLQIKVPA
ncbi:MAG TPA: hypothetical protein VFG24_06815 [Nitrosopumilaceae archaeon]|nr:hypothetical protein [Nitrosopumilaceae archaeon]